jgi:hypothetical protein
MDWLCLWHGEDVKRGKKYPMTLRDMTDETGEVDDATRAEDEEKEELQDEDKSMAECEDEIAKWEQAKNERIAVHQYDSILFHNGSRSCLQTYRGATWGSKCNR